MNTHTHSPRRTGVALFGALALCVVVACGAKTSNLLGGDGGAGFGSGSILGGSGNGQGSGSAGGPGALLPGVFTGNGACLKLGAGCTTSGDCCSGDCVSGVCQYPACVADNGACASNGQCCSQNCAGGKCTALNSSCSTVGNGCTSDATCCSKHCAANGTCQASSFCAQPGDACSVGSGCCTGTCTIAANQTVGTCAASAPGGPANCGLEDGQLCGGTGTSGTGGYDGGLPACGGACCSRACAPWGPTGVFVCQPASGCHVVGDLCTSDGDCCGSQGLPGGSHKPVTCVINSGDKIGICRNPMGCKPDGDVCKLKTMSCNASCDCCAGNCETMDTCKQDNVGVP
ncbi:MAG TPA: hypothetical protein VGY54_27250, partial [Polyangiaceae bacterium]|nr:hypothetical protein [Polyangiaceae bacterium]